MIFVLLGLFLPGMKGCGKEASNDPEVLYHASQRELKRGDLHNALADADRGLRTVPDEHSDWYWRFTTIKAEILIWQGLSQQSLELLNQDLPASLRTSETEVWRKLTEASAYTNLSAFDMAEKTLADARALAQSSHPELLGYVALREGTLADFQGTPETASTMYRVALNAAREQRDLYLEASALGSLGLIETEQGHYDASVDWNREALRVSQDSGAKGLAAKIQLNTGWSYFELGDYQNALATFRDAENAAIAAGLSRDRVICRVNIGAVEYYLHDYSAAERHSFEAAQLARDLGDKRLLAETLNTLSSISIVEGKLAPAEEYNREALSSLRSIDDHAGEMSVMLIAGRIEAQRRHFHQAERLFVRARQDRNADLATKWEAEARLANVYASEQRPSDAEKEFNRAITTIEEARHSIQDDELRLAFLSSAAEFYDDYVEFLIHRGKVGDALRFADRTRSQTLTDGIQSAARTAQGPARKIQPQQLARKLRATLLIYWIGEKRSFMWIVTPTNLAYFVLPPGPRIDAAVNAYRHAILDGHDVLASDRALGQQLYSMLVGPVDKFVTKNACVILLPGERLEGLNFETLIVPRPNPHFWIEDVTLSTASSLTLLSASETRTGSKGKSLLLVGNPEPPNADFPALAQAPAEMQKVASHFRQSQCRILQGKEATATAYLQSNAGQFSYLHFVTHGTASETHPLESAIILSKQGDSYKLYAREIVRHPLGAELVTISACNGAGTRAYVGEGLVGLAWAFLRAGARNVIASVWEVSDASSTGQLMDELYGGLDRGEDPATALRKAKLVILKSNDSTVFHKPFYWAPFQLYIGL